MILRSYFQNFVIREENERVNERINVLNILMQYISEKKLTIKNQLSALKIENCDINKLYIYI